MHNAETEEENIDEIDFLKQNKSSWQNHQNKKRLVKKFWKSVYILIYDEWFFLVYNEFLPIMRKWPPKSIEKCKKDTDRYHLKKLLNRKRCSILFIIRELWDTTFIFLIGKYFKKLIPFHGYGCREIDNLPYWQNIIISTLMKNYQNCSMFFL